MIFWFENHNNDVQHSEAFVFIMSSKSKTNSGLCVNDQNFRRFVGLVNSRRLIKNEWEINPNRYLAPHDSRVGNTIIKTNLNTW
jgi:hypothetical protein